MSTKNHGDNDFHLIADEADLLLEALNEADSLDDSLDASLYSASGDVVDGQNFDVVDNQRDSVDTANSSAHPALVFLIIAILLSPLLLLVVWRIGEQTSVESLPALRYASSCGSPPAAGKRWWPVLGPPDRRLLRTIRDRYCGDAYITSEGSLQVASFDSLEGAERFRRQLDRVLGDRFRVGQPHWSSQ